MKFDDHFLLTYRDIEPLTSDQFIELVSTLLFDEAFRLNIHHSKISITLAANDPDGGADAIVESGETQSRYFPNGTSVWQLKKSWPSEAKLIVELNKSVVQEVFAAGGSYVMVIGQHMTPRVRHNRLAKLTALARAANCMGSVLLFGADDLAAWASNVYVAALAFRPSIRGYRRASRERKSVLHSPRFVADQARQEIQESIRKILFDQDSTTTYVRIEGDAGIGKSRLALELVGSLGLDDLVLYSPNEADNSLFSQIVENDKAQAIVIVDESDGSYSLKLEEWTRRSEGRLRIIAIGPANPGARSSHNVYVLTPLPQENIESIIRATAPGLGDLQIRRVAEITSGYIKLSIALAEAIQRGSTSLTQLLDDRHIGDLVTRILIRDEKARKALRGAALLTRMGWQGDVATEGLVIANFVGMSWNEFYDALGPAMDKGLIAKRGRYLYVTPELLALWLAAETWRNHAHRVRELLNELPTQGSRQSLLDRLALLGGTLPGVQGVLEELISDQSLFGNIDSIESYQSANLFAVLAKGAPRAALATLLRIIGSSSQERLLAFETGRRHILWSLERLLLHSDTFYDAARLVLRLAEAENEALGNSATEVWKDIFLAVLAETTVPPMERMVLLREAFASESATTRSLAIGATASALDIHEHKMIIQEGNPIPSERWRPQTLDDVLPYRRAILDLLARGMKDAVPTIRKQARQILIESARGLVRMGLADDVVVLFSGLEGEDETENRKIWEHIQQILKWSKNEITTEQHAILESEASRIYGGSLIDRMKRYLGPHTSVDWPLDDEDQELHPQVIADKLAKEAYSHLDEVIPLLPWIVSSQNSSKWAFAYRLGMLDKADHKWLGPLLDAVRVGSDAQLLAAYLAGTVEVNGSLGTAWREALLDEWSQDPTLAIVTFDVTKYARASEKAAMRLLKLVDSAWLQPQLLGQLGFGSWTQPLSPEILKEILLRLLKDDSPQTYNACLLILTGWLREKSNKLSQSLRELLWQILEQPNSWGGPLELVYEWDEMATMLIRDSPARITRLLIKTIVETSDFSIHSRRAQIIEKAMTVAPTEVWHEVGSALLSTEHSYQLEWALEHIGFLQRIESTVVINWLETKGSDGAIVVASSLKPSGNKLSPLMRYLLIHFHERVGGTLSANFISGSWMGSRAKYMEGKLELAQKWLDDDNPNILEWVRNLINDLTESIKRVRLQEEEEDLLR